MAFGWRRFCSRKTCILLNLVLFISVLLGLGLGLGLGISRMQSGSNSASQNTTVPTINPPVNGSFWQPSGNHSWQIVLENPIELNSSSLSVSPNVDVFDIDLFTNSETVLQSLRQLGKKVICYFSAGSYEPDRPDSSQFQTSDMGDDVSGWPGEKWLNISSVNVRNIMAARIQLASQKGCDGVDPDNVDGYVSKSLLFASTVQCTTVEVTKTGRACRVPFKAWNRTDIDTAKFKWPTSHRKRLNLLHDLPLKYRTQLQPQYWPQERPRYPSLTLWSSPICRQ